MSNRKVRKSQTQKLRKRQNPEELLREIAHQKEHIEKLKKEIERQEAIILNQGGLIQTYQHLMSYTDVIVPPDARETLRILHERNQENIKLQYELKKTQNLLSGLQGFHLIPPDQIPLRTRDKNGNWNGIFIGITLSFRERDSLDGIQVWHGTGSMSGNLRDVMTEATSRVQMACSPLPGMHLMPKNPTGLEFITAPEWGLIFTELSTVLRDTDKFNDLRNRLFKQFILPKYEETISNEYEQYQQKRERLQQRFHTVINQTYKKMDDERKAYLEVRKLSSEEMREVYQKLINDWNPEN